MARDNDQKRARKQKKKAGGPSTPASSKPAAPAPRPAAPTPRAQPAHFDDWLARPESTALPSWRELWSLYRFPAVILFTLGLVVRAAVLLQLGATPYAEVANIDSDSYLTWATEIATDGWFPTRLAYQSPLYAWYLAALQEVFGPTTWPPRIGQILLGSLSPVLLFAIGTRLVGSSVGWIAGIGLCLYGPLVLEEVTISKTSLLVFTALGSFALYLRYAPVAHLRGLFFSGVLFGITVVGVAQWVLGFLLIGAYTLLVAPVRRVQSAAAFLVAGILMVAPIAAWNSSQAKGLVLTSGGAGLNFFTGNNERASGLPARPPGLRDVPRYEEADSRRLAERDMKRSLGEGEVSSYWNGRALDFMVSQPAAWAHIVWQKFLVLWNGYEVPDNYHFSFMRAHFLPLLYGTLDFGLVAPFAIAGLFLPFWRRRQLTALYIVTAATLAPLLIVYVRSRYRIPAVPFLLVFAAIAIERLRHALVHRDRMALATRGSTLVLAALLVNRTHCEPAHHGFPALCLSGDLWYDLEWLKLGEWYEARGDYDRASSFSRRAAECSSPRSPGSIQFSIATIAARSAVSLHGAGKKEEALARADETEAAYERAIENRFRIRDAYFNRIMVLGKLGLAERTRKAADEALRASALEDSALLQLSATFERDGQCDAAVEVMTAVDEPQAESVRARCQPAR